MQEMVVERYNKPDIKLTFTKENDVFLATNYAGMTFTSEEARSLAEALQIMTDEAEKKYVVVLPSGRGNGKPFGCTFLTALTASIAVTQSPYEVIERGSMTLAEVERISPHYVPLAIPVEEFKQEEIGEF